jgi:diacylglycerol kinase (ATP)
MDSANTANMELMFLSLFAGLVLLMILVTKLWRRIRQLHYDLPAGDSQKVHRWFLVDAFARPIYCAVSRRRILEGAFCELCGVYVADENANVADKTLPCKMPAAPMKSVMSHQWVHGNLPPGAKCASCGEPCTERAELCDVQCCWCSCTAHDSCSSSLSQCDLGPYADSIVPPTCVILRRAGRVKGRRRTVVDSVTEPAGRQLDTWRPLIAMANRQSGGGDGDFILRQLRGILNPIQVSLLNCLIIVRNNQSDA